MAKVQSVDRKEFLFASDLNPLHEESLGSSTTNLHDRAARDLASSSGCEQMVTEPRHIDREALGADRCS